VWFLFDELGGGQFSGRKTILTLQKEKNGMRKIATIILDVMFSTDCNGCDYIQIFGKNLYR
jgi:hypothetical protein